MIRFALICGNGHGFEAWFGTGRDYENQVEAHAIACPACGSAEVKKVPMAPALLRGTSKPAAESQASPARKKTYTFLKDLRAHLTANAEHVGPAFAEEARAIHYGETEARSIYGEASREEAKALNDEGIPAMPLPPLPEDHH
jgi:hypothetical protein